MKLKKYMYIFLSLLYFDLIFNLFTFDSYLFTSVINMVLFALINATVIYIITSLFDDRVNKIITCIVYLLLWFWYSFHHIFYKVLVTPFSLLLFRQTDQTLKFGKNIIISIFSNFYIIILFLIPFLLVIIFKKKMSFEKVYGKKILVMLLFLLFTIGIYVGNIFIQGRNKGSIYNLFYETNNVSLNIQNLGVLGATYLDIKRIIFGFDEKIEKVNLNLDNQEEKEMAVDYGYNNLNINFDSGNGNFSIINDYIKNELGTRKNEYTGMFKGKNLIFVVAESFSEIAVSEKYTPTLYKLVHEGFYFKNFYTSNNLSTIGGEFQALTGLYADNSILSSWRNGWAYYPYGLGTVFRNLGYNTYAYHDNSAYYQDRNIYLKSQGFDNYKGCYNGLEKVINCEVWPQSDVEMVDKTVSDYVTADKPFMVYYMTVSGHFYYNFNGNYIASKNRKLVDDMDYPEEVRGYVATQIELDRAMELLLKKLKEANRLDDTVIVLLADHYPYNLPIDDINLLSSYERDSLIEANSNNLIIYNSKMKSEEIDKVGMSIDVLPTVLNLFGIEYDSRIIMGKDILSTTEGIAIFKNQSWVTNKGTYYASNGRFVPNSEEVPKEYIDAINSVVANRVAISRMIVDSNYYKSLFNT